MIWTEGGKLEAELASPIEILDLEQVCGTGRANIFGERTP
jgi:hypothetical protein